MAVQGLSRDSWAEVNLGHIVENIHSFQHHLNNDTCIMAVVKANAYGHGAIEVARAALDAGASWLGVALLDEAVELRQNGIQAPILVFGWVRPEDAWLAAKHDISLTVYQNKWLLQAERLCPGGIQLNVHLKLDTGMGRIGAREKEEIRQVVKEILDNSCFRLQGTYTHFATADEKDTSYFTKQYECFRTMLSWLSDWGAHPEIIHCANSATALNFPDKVFNLVRLGISMYGLTPAEEMKPDLPFSLKQAFTLYSRLIHVKKIDPGDAISYGATYVATEEEWIGTVPLGYADGWTRKLAENGEVLVNGRRAPIVGRICMDFFMVKLPEKLEVGTKVTLIGSEGNQSITVDDIARQLGTITYEIPCMIGYRVPRIYRSSDAN
ncbi:MAG TPA: alanine racemase [Bacillales bacterium]|nr:alanine racemase [Bacillales bacterium]